MKEIFENSNKGQLISGENYIDFVNDKEKIEYLKVLKELTEKHYIPYEYISFLESIEDEQDQNAVSSKLFKIYLYLYSKMKSPRKVFDWLIKGRLPSETFHGNSMNLFYKKIKEFKTVSKNVKKIEDRIQEQRYALSQKSNKTIQNSLNNQEIKLQKFNNENNSIMSLLDQLLEEINTSLASGKKL